MLHMATFTESVTRSLTTFARENKCVLKWLTMTSASRTSHVPVSCQYQFRYYVASRATQSLISLLPDNFVFLFLSRVFVQLITERQFRIKSQGFGLCFVQSGFELGIFIIKPLHYIDVFQKL